MRNLLKTFSPNTAKEAFRLASNFPLSSARAPQPQHRPRRHPFQVPCVHGRVGSDDDHHRPFSLICETASFKNVAEIVATQFSANGNTCDCEHIPIIGLNENSDCVPAQLRRQVARGGSNAALEREGFCSGTCTDRAFLDRPSLGTLDGGEHVLPRDVPSPDVV